MIEGKVRYWDLGRGKASGIFDIKATDEEDFNFQLEKEFRKHLMSNDISFANGEVVVGGFRKVGNFEFIAKEK
jgi:hypothetical protein